MQHDRRQLLKSAAGLMVAGAGLPAAGSAFAQGGTAATHFPSKPIVFVLQSPAGGADDAMGRIILGDLTKELGQPVVLDFKPGGGGQLAAGLVARAAPDGYTLLFVTTGPLFYAPYLTSKLQYDTKRDFTYISQMTSGGLVLVANKDVPISNVNEMVAWIRQQGKGKVAYGSYGVGTVSHLLMSYLSESRNLEMTHVAYRGGAPLATDLIGGQVPVGINSITTTAPHIREGRLRALAVFTPQRDGTLPEVPTMIESGFTDDEFKVISGMWLAAPANTPPEVVSKIESAVRKVMLDPAIRARFVKLGTTPVGSTAEEARKFFEEAQPRVAKLVKISGASIN